MPRQFLRTNPVQATKLAAIIATLLFAGGGIYGYPPNQGHTGLFLIISLSFGLAIAVTIETLLDGSRSIATANSITEQFDDGQMYTIVRVIEIAGTIVWMGGFVYLISTIPEGPMAGPGAIGLLFMMAGIGVVILGGSLLRTLGEYYNYRRTSVT